MLVQHNHHQITSLQPSKLHRDISYIPPTDTGSLCLAVDSTHTVVGLFRLLVRRSGTHCQMNSEIRHVMLTASNSSLKQSCSALTRVTSALEVIFNVMRSINPRFTYLLTYLHYHHHHHHHHYHHHHHVASLGCSITQCPCLMALCHRSAGEMPES